MHREGLAVLPVRMSGCKSEAPQALDPESPESHVAMSFPSMTTSCALGFPSCSLVAQSLRLVGSRIGVQGLGIRPEQGSEA